MKKIKFSIITVTYNSEKTISRTIHSILEQDITDDITIEYLIIDGKSADRTVETAEQFRERLEQKKIEYHIVSEPDNGIYDAMNKGIRQATGDVIGILNSDDWYEPCAVRVAAETFAETGCDLLFANICMHKANGEQFIKKARQRKFQTSRDWNHPTTFVKAELYQQNQFHNLGIHDDYAFYLQMRRQNRNIVTVDKVLANFQMGGESNRKDLRAARKRIHDRYYYCYRMNGYSRWYLAECILIEAAKMILG